MTRLLIGTYRQRQHIEDCLRSMDEHLKGVTDIVIVDDSGDTDHCAWLAQYGKVIQVGRQGYTVAMRHLSEAAEREAAFILEEDFTFTQDMHIDELVEILWHRPYLAQIALLRGPHFPIEHQFGGLIEALQYKGNEFKTVAGVIEHVATFTMNPALIRGEVWAAGWPIGRLSEERKRDQLRGKGYRFGFLPGIRVEHHGTRQGHGY
jgi:hypothetical protein